MSAFTFGLLTAVTGQLHGLDPENQKAQQANTKVYASDGKSILEVLHGSEARVVVPSAQISPWLKHAIVAIEDKRFYEHRGIDVHGIFRALWTDITNGSAVQGGSTITQQFVKNSDTGNAPTIARKLREAALATQLELHWTKDQILTAYLNTIYFGNGAYGVEEACRIYFGHSAAVVTPAEAALLAGIPEDPSLYDPVAHPAQALARRNLVLLEMYKQGQITPHQYAVGIRAKMPKPQSVHLPSGQSTRAPYFANYVTEQLVSKYGAKKVYSGGLHVTTTIDLGLQKLAREAIAKELPPSVGPTAALVALDPRTGAVLAMIGGRNYHQSQFNLATQGERQPGSSFKPFVLAAALKEGISPATVLTSHTVSIDAGGRVWRVNNFEGEDLGPIDLSKAIAYSDNTVFAQLTNVVGPGNVAAAAKELGVSTPLPSYFSIGLGAEPATPLDMARAYSAFANGGDRVDGSTFGNEPRAIECVQSPGQACKANAPVNTSVLTSTQAAIVDQLLEGVIGYGTGTAAAIPGYTVAGKTGTTENYGDAWFVGYTPQLVTAVWVGYPDKLVPMLTQFHGHAVVGGSYPALIWKAFMTKALAYENDSPESFPAPPALNVEQVKVVNRAGVGLARDNGYCSTAVNIEFFVGDAPSKIAPCKPNEVDVPDLRGATLAAAETRLTGQPLTWKIVYKPATPGEKLGVVIGQIPNKGTLSAYNQVLLVLPKAQHGVVPKLVGLTAKRARAKVGKLKVKLQITGSAGGRVVSQNPRWGVAIAPGMQLAVKLADAAPPKQTGG
ncbi:MAG TPA: PBP1A family penicillin-binding protein [Gaiellaceae bacterium]|nr:PBP1A family penicillin-binding protein [Gaiellaceae bacterium]